MTEIKTEMIEYVSEAGNTPGYLASPAREGLFPGVVIIQEWWGLVPHIQDVSNRFAREGFVALAPDLYHGQVADEPDEARKLAMELDRARAVGEIVAAIQCLRELESISPKKIGVVGWCMGGWLAIATAAANSHVGAVVVFYGNPGDLSFVPKIQAPLLGLYGEHDHGIPVDLVRSFESALNEHGIVNEIYIYPNAQHAFFNDTRKEIYSPDAAQDAWTRTLDWFRQYLR